LYWIDPLEKEDQVDWVISDLIDSEEVEYHYDLFGVKAMSFEFQSREQSELWYVQKLLPPLAFRVLDHSVQLQISHHRLRKYQRLIRVLVYRDVVHQNAIASAVVWAIVAE
jgi:hypothetical protein